MKKRLGKGLDALIPGNMDNVWNDETDTRQDEIDVDNVRPNPYQPRKEIDEDKLEEMAASIRQMGVVQPILVKKDGSDYILVAGERRLRAARKAGLKTIPAVIGSFDPWQMMQIALVENLQREDLNPVEEAYAFKKLLEEFALTQEEVAQRIGKSRSYIANTIRLLSLDEEMQREIKKGNIKVGQIRPLLSVEDNEERKNIASKIIKEKLTSRDVEKLVKNKKQKKVEEEKKDIKDPFLNDIEEQIRKKFGTKVKIKMKGKEGRIELSFFGSQDLTRLAELLIDG